VISAATTSVPTSQWRMCFSEDAATLPACIVAVRLEAAVKQA
jgi:hypothetical protein